MSGLDELSESLHTKDMNWDSILKLILLKYQKEEDTHIICIGDWTKDEHRFNAFMALSLGALRKFEDSTMKRKENKNV